MTRKPLFLIIPVIAVIAALVLFFQRDNTGRSPNAPSASASGSGLPTGSGAQMPPNAGMNPTASGTPSGAPADPARTPTSATPRSPSGEPAQRQ
jgi:hypothetical protein